MARRETWLKASARCRCHASKNLDRVLRWIDASTMGRAPREPHLDRTRRPPAGRKKSPVASFSMIALDPAGPPVRLTPRTPASPQGRERAFPRCPTNLKMNIVVIILAVVAVTAALTYLSARRRARTWSGVVTDIRRQTVQNDDAVENVVVIQYRTDSGTTGNERLPAASFAKTFPTLAVGDRLIKSPGEYLPKKI
jgi:hypothetical protein